ncbi:2,3-diaminopropionate biosynthesis protein SbnA [Saccharothrix xinjiangensis]|uniref:2,3-diaminopropionate biosynthesis protein SbnA n=1 Tax=Saccharothrix xinjiangensis TaxID=204798 RepID=A0ABV9YC27_9PSEU
MTSIITSPADFNVGDLYVDLRGAFGRSLFLKCEGFNFAGSIKLKAALEMVEVQERLGALAPGGTVVESSSGNMGVALSVVAAARGYRFVCVTDVRSTAAARRVMAAYGAEVHVVDEPDEAGGYLGTRLARVRRLCREHPDYVWLNQYANPGNWGGHYRTTGPEIAKAFPELDVLFVGAGTTGTLMGCARYFREHHPSVRVVAIDSVGSVTFGMPPGRRMIPGLGSSVRPAILDESWVDEVLHVPEVDAVRACRAMLRKGFLFGGSTGTAVAGALTWLDRAGAGDDLTAVTISPDLGNHYLDTVYDEQWGREVFDLDG